MKRIIIVNVILIILILILPKPETKIQVEETQEEQQVIEQVQEEIIQEEPKIIEPEISRGLNESRELKKVTEPIIEDKSLEGYRITSYYPNDDYQTGITTGSGKTIYDFDTMSINGKNVYTYQDKIVIAGATKELLKTGYNVKGSQEKQNKHYFNYYDTGKIKLYDNWYEFIVLDSCGASMWKGYYRLDIFVPTSTDVIDTKNAEIIYN